MAYIKQTFWLILVGCISLLVACSSNPTVNDSSGPVLLQEVAIDATSVLPTRPLTDTPSPTASVLEVPQSVPLTVSSDFLLITPTLPPSKTPTMTPTITPTATATPIVIPSLIPFTPTPQSALPTSAIMPLITSQIPTAFPQPQFPQTQQPPILGTTPFPPVPESCQLFWFFIEPRPTICPLAPPTTSPAAYQAFEHGYMIWVGNQGAIYVMFNDVFSPRWQVFRDNYQEGMPTVDDAFNNPPNPATFQPKRGFGLLWRNNEAIRSRIGWALTFDEQGYTTQSQTGADSTLYMTDAQGNIFMLSPHGIDWTRTLVIGGVTPPQP